MKRIFEFIPSDHDIIVTRTLVLVHQAIDNAFPSAKPASQRFAKTAFGDEPTLTKSLPSDRAKGVFEETVTKKSGDSDEESTDEERTLPGYHGAERLWKHSLTAIIFLIICIILIYVVIL